MKPAIVLCYEEKIPTALFDEFAAQMADQIDALEISPRPTAGPFASVEWLIPTAIILFAGKAYFDGFLKEAGKDHYHVFKQAATALAVRLAAIKSRVISTPGKISTAPAYSFTFSIMSDGAERQRLKLLIPSNLSDSDVELVVAELMDFLFAFHSGTLPEPVIANMKATRVIGGTLLVTYNIDEQRIEFPDPISRLTEHTPKSS